MTETPKGSPKGQAMPSGRNAPQPPRQGQGQPAPVPASGSADPSGTSIPAPPAKPRPPSPAEAAASAEAAPLAFDDAVTEPGANSPAAATPTAANPAAANPPAPNASAPAATASAVGASASTGVAGHRPGMAGAAAPGMGGSAPAGGAMGATGAPKPSGVVPPAASKAPTPPAAAASRLAPPPPPPRHKLNSVMLPVLAAGGVLVLIAAWLIIADNRGDPDIPPARIEALERQSNALAGLPEQLRALQTGPLAETQQRLAGLEAGQQQREQALREGVDGLRSRLDTLQGERDASRQAMDQRLAVAERRFDDADRAAAQRIEQSGQALSQRITAAEAQLTQRFAAAEAALGPRFAEVEGQMQQRLAASEEAARTRNAARDQALDQRFANLEQRETRLAAAERRLGRLVASTAASSALAAGKPLGRALAGLPEAPAALTRFATAAPPTEAGLRLSFEDAIRAARAASEPANTGQTVWESAATRLSNLVTVRRGETVVWGDAIGSELELAQRSLEAGDLPAAVKRVEGLPAPVQAAMAGWLDQARALIAARAALEELTSAGGQG
jgi:hypothetical protein